MMEFTGFSKECVKFWSDIVANNDKVWFEKNRQVYEELVQQPSRNFVTAMGQKLRQISPGVNADPRVNKSLFKIHRDTRFSPDKTPFKTHMGILFWEGTRKRMECSCYYFHLEPPNLMLGAGIYMFPKPHLQAFRNSVVEPKHGSALDKAVSAVTGHRGFNLGTTRYKKTPRGFDPEHKFADYLLHNGLTVGVTREIPDAFFSAELIDFCFDSYKKMAPLHNWLVAMTERL